MLNLGSNCMKPIPTIVLFALTALLASEVLLLFKTRTISQAEVAKSVQTNFIEMDKRLGNRLDQIRDDFTQRVESVFADPNKTAMYNALFESEGLAVIISEQDSIIFWSNNNVPFIAKHKSITDKGIVQLQNGWYFYRVEHHNRLKITGLKLVHSTYKFQNKFLVNDFSSLLRGNAKLFFVNDKSDQIGHKILDSDGDFAFTLVSKRKGGLVQDRTIVSVLAILGAVMSLVLLSVYLFRLTSRGIKQGSPIKWLGFFVFSLIAFRLLVYITGLPSALTTSKLFSPEFFASSWFLPSLGDLLLNVFIFGFIGFLLYNSRYNFKSFVAHKSIVPYVSFFALALVLFMCWQALLTIESLVLNSRLDFGVGFVFNFDLTSFFGFFIIGALFFSIYFFSQFLLSMAINVAKNPLLFLGSVALFVLSFLVLVATPVKTNTYAWVFFFSLVLVFYIRRLGAFSMAGYVGIFVAFFLFSIISTFALLDFNQKKSRLQRQTLALSLSSDQDHLAEFLFLDIEMSLFDDNQLKNLVVGNPTDSDVVYRYLQHHYFYDYWEKYDIQVTLTRPGEKWFIPSLGFEVAIDEYFEDLIQKFGNPTVSDNLFFLDNSYYPGRKSYLCKIPIEVKQPGGGTELHLVFLEFNTKFGVRESGLPELLVDDKADAYRGFDDLSYAKYIDGRLIHKIGNFVYSMDLSVYGQFEGQFTFFYRDGHEHLLFKKNERFHLLVSSPKKSFIESIAPFSYLFIIMFVISLFLSRDRLKEWLQFTFKRRVQVYMVGLVAFSVLSIGMVAAIFLLKIYEQKNLDAINEKSQSVLSEMESIFSSWESLDDRFEYTVREKLRRLHRIFFSDINVFSPDGKLVATSRPGVFEAGLIGRMMNPVAFSYLKSQQKGQFLHNEKIGSLEFASSYQPLHNGVGHLVGYVNLPYFARQSQFKNELSLFVLAFVNIITILLMLALIVALVVSSYVTAPLQIIKDNISRIQFGSANQKLFWRRKDEIGQLVYEYNRMIDELVHSAELLAKSERESAWREMAKQVAHEIKNPLTPMRLSIQYLERAYHDNVPDWEQRLERFSKTMIEQIDNLSIIATEFSDFAQMPAGIRAEIDLKDFIPEVIEIFNNNDRVTIDLNSLNTINKIVVVADKNQLTRVFYNLVNNAIQAYTKDENALVLIEVIEESGFAKCSVTDYGCGIEEELKPNIFSPNFTTKTSGMGLGLSIVKSIIQSHGGTVSFCSVRGKGSTFWFTLPLN